MTGRSDDEGHTLHDLVLEPIDVRCPRCSDRARLAQVGDDEPTLHMPRRLSCVHCGFARDHDGRVLGFSGEGADPCFGHPLWYRTATAKGTLWAYHRRHLTDLRAYIAASDRNRSHQETASNRGHFSRLPTWVKSATNREMVVKALDRMLADG